MNVQKKSQKRVQSVRLILLLCMMLSLNQLVAQVAKFCINTETIEGEYVMASVVLESSIPIIGIQFTMDWNPESLDFDSIYWTNKDQLSISDPLDKNFGYPGTLIDSSLTSHLTFVWNAPFSGAQFIPLLSEDPAILFQIRFRKLSSAPFELQISDIPTMVHIISDEEKTMPYVVSDDCASPSLPIVSGQIRTLAEDCLTPVRFNHFNGWLVSFSNGVDSQKVAITESGEYAAQLAPGMYDVKVRSSNGLWAPCLSDNTLEVVATEQVQYDLEVSAVDYCHQLSVDLFPDFIYLDGDYHIFSYSNQGTAVAHDVVIDLQFDQLAEVVSIDFYESEAIGDQQYRIFIGTVNPGESNLILVKVKYADHIPIGQTLCTSATITPSTNCIAPSTEWSGASIEVSGTCLGDSIQFLLRNVGTGPMIAPKQAIVTEDIVMLGYHDFQLNAGDTKALKFPSTGKTYRMEAEQVDHHPGSSFPSATVEGCTNDTGQSLSLGITNLFFQNDEDPQRDVECLEYGTQFYGNSMQALPRGWSEHRFINPNRTIEYHVLIQNQGDVQVDAVVVIDTLPIDVDPSSIEILSASDTISWRIINDRILEITFTNIVLSSAKY